MEQTAEAMGDIDLEARIAEFRQWNSKRKSLRADIYKNDKGEFEISRPLDDSEDHDIRAPYLLHIDGNKVTLGLRYMFSTPVEVDGVSRIERLMRVMDNEVFVECVMLPYINREGSLQSLYMRKFAGGGDLDFVEGLRDNFHFIVDDLLTPRGGAEIQKAVFMSGNNLLFYENKKNNPVQIYSRGRLTGGIPVKSSLSSHELVKLIKDMPRDRFMAFQELCLTDRLSPRFKGSDFYDFQLDTDLIDDQTLPIVLDKDEFSVTTHTGGMDVVFSRDYSSGSPGHINTVILMRDDVLGSRRVDGLVTAFETIEEYHVSRAPLVEHVSERTEINIRDLIENFGKEKCIVVTRDGSAREADSGEFVSDFLVVGYPQKKYVHIEGGYKVNPKRAVDLLHDVDYRRSIAMIEADVFRDAAERVVHKGGHMTNLFMDRFIEKNRESLRPDLRDRSNLQLRKMMEDDLVENSWENIQGMLWFAGLHNPHLRTFSFAVGPGFIGYSKEGYIQHHNLPEDLSNRFTEEYVSGISPFQLLEDMVLSRHRFIMNSFVIEDHLHPNLVGSTAFKGLKHGFTMPCPTENFISYLGKYGPLDVEVKTYLTGEEQESLINADVRYERLGQGYLTSLLSNTI